MSSRIGSSAAPRGRVALVGAGPGDPELLTLKAVRAIGRATVLLVDDLVSDGVLAHADPKARIVHVGKRGGCKSTPQAFIDKLMSTEARNGEQVVRLKGGDPFVFGRGGEEAERLRAQGIDVEVVNGITAGLAALPVRSPMQRSRLRLHRGAEQPGPAGRAGGDDESGPFPCPRIAGLNSFTLRVNDACLGVLTDVPFTPLRFVRVPPASVHEFA